jgi:hypothetical protein
MGDYASEFLLDVRFFVFGDVIQNLFVSDNFLSFVLIDRHSELDPGGIIFQWGLMIFKEFENAFSELFSSWLSISKSVQWDLQDWRRERVVGHPESHLWGC